VNREAHRTESDDDEGTELCGGEHGMAPRPFEGVDWKGCVVVVATVRVLSTAEAADSTPISDRILYHSLASLSIPSSNSRIQPTVHHPLLQYLVRTN
jgi:hypothetical protein